ncbi:putative 2-aminoethylphosphonate ABC transporter ATP-binding protein [Serratia sp. DD3]|uniref:putative 2-aminoethylphosphonate ABC transporter ATP-binding protein n=1 Tax=Serratia sp. DD3 TaxID=1410619 RepID=UPI0003C4E65E|nr:putative 2-aminoethylphosphonate ABC transporter ATP-binding protein [Serratia sp. DD3]KEY56490.1 sulfate/thiosulfate import ATP-binding protein CysA [Serratia sp. DD3]KEY56710.1 sulfate/thiosulfate import ATP-binding protein CysA [Serratia sp. DD3]KEY58357.1 sulfate/thiosulfate import ATP-binding protein CysA [Serratia sp. DD3]KEY59421.1 sulfate/thiosulfate import ATP-binding protein CysA [Serratia sp. DD3]
MTQPYLDIKHLNKHFKAFQALKDISLTVKKGEFVCFLGPSGCGKTTLLRAIAGLDLPDSGEIWQGGCDISQLPPQRRDFGIVFQSYALFPNLTVAENIAFGLRNQGLDSQVVKERVEHWLALIGLGAQSNKYPSQISGGQQQRVALARALALSPGLLLLDEPLSALDALVRTHLRSEIRALQQRLGITTIMVTHDQEEALTMADRIVVMEHGTIVQVGTPQEIYHHPASRFVASFVGSMNFLDTQVLNAQQVRLNEQPLPLTNHAAAGSTLQVAIRPEAISLAPPAQQGLQARIEQVEFLGSAQRLICLADTLMGPQRLLVQLSNDEGQDWRSGMACSLHWPTSAMQPFYGKAA